MLLGGTVLIENIFAVPGMGQLLVTAINDRDVTVVQGIVLVVAVSIVFFNTLSDILLAILDPRVRRAR